MAVSPGRPARIPDLSHRARLLAFGSAGGLIVAGGLCALLVSGIAGEVIGWTIVALGLGAIVLLVFYEVGLSEDRELAEEEEQRRKQARRPRRPI